MSDFIYAFDPPFGVYIKPGNAGTINIPTVTENLSSINVYAVTVTETGEISLSFDDVVVKLNNPNTTTNFNTQRGAIGGRAISSLACIAPTVITHTKIATIDPDIPPPVPEHTRWEACYRCCQITVDGSGNITDSAYGVTTNNLDLPQALIDNNLVPTVAGTFMFIFVFYGWRKHPGDTPGGWISADDKYDIWTDYVTAELIP